MITFINFINTACRHSAWGIPQREDSLLGREATKGFGKEQH